MFLIAAREDERRVFPPHPHPRMKCRDGGILCNFAYCAQGYWADGPERTKITGTDKPRQPKEWRQWEFGTYSSLCLFVFGHKVPPCLSGYKMWGKGALHWDICFLPLVGRHRMGLEGLQFGPLQLELVACLAPPLLAFRRCGKIELLTWAVNLDTYLALSCFMVLWNLF